MRSIGQRGIDQGRKQLGDELILLFAVFGLGNGLAEMAHGIERALEAKARQVVPRDASGLNHETANQVVRNEVHEDFALDCDWAFTAQRLHLQGGFDLAQEQFHAPAAQV